MIRIKNLTTSIEGHQILKGLDLMVKGGEIHAIMGPNGSGKSTLSKVLAGHPDYSVDAGEIEFEINSEYKNLLELEPDERAREGIFLAFQYPVEIPGVSNIKFLKTSFDAICKHHGIAEMNDKEFEEYVKQQAHLIEIDSQFLSRPVNEGFSGGEKKKNEILQMAILKPRLAILDETDSGLDIDALKIVAKGVNQLKNRNTAIIIITHYQRLLDYITPDFVHVLSDGKIVKTGDHSLALKLEKQGYDWLS